jgi:hypothetical protein
MTGTCPTCGASIELKDEGGLTLGYCNCNNAGRRVVINFITPAQAPKPEPWPVPVSIAAKGKKK